MVPSLAVAAGAAAGCKADDPIKRPSGEEDAAPTEDLEPPSLEGVPERTPNTYVAARGTTDGTRVVTQGSPGGTLLTIVLPGGQFCQDTPINTEGPTSLRYYAMSGDGRVSQPASIEVIHDPSSPPPGSQSCSGVIPPECADEEDCASEGDEDCDGLIDECDSKCSGCTDDAYEPNDIPVNVPSMLPGTYDMQLCPCREDWFAFNVDMGTRIHAVATFVHAQIDIDMKLFRAGAEGTGTSDLLVTSASTNDQEEVDFVADMPGAYFLQVYPFGAEDNPSGSYSITFD